VEALSARQREFQVKDLSQVVLYPMVKGVAAHLQEAPCAKGSVQVAPSDYCWRFHSH
jgi:hypothetical protein